MYIHVVVLGNVKYINKHYINKHSTITREVVLLASQSNQWSYLMCMADSVLVKILSPRDCWATGD